MWETDWAAVAASDQFVPPATESFVGRHAVAHTYLTFWSEHCVECTYPSCYTTCSLYASRPDGHCQRFQYGIRRDERMRGLDGAAYDIHFKRWGKLETKLCYGPVTPRMLHRLSRADASALRLLAGPSIAWSRVSRTRSLNRKYNRLREVALSAMTRPARQRIRHYDEFVVEALNPLSEEIGLVVEAWYDRLVYRSSLRMSPGYNLHRIDFASMNLDLSRTDGRVALHVSGDREARLIFSALDFVAYRSRPEVPQPAQVNVAPRIKCVVWDLDNTLWDGTLVEDGIDGIRPREAVVSAIRELDRRGVLHSVASRNDHGAAWNALDRFGLQDFFLYPAIHWGPKSDSVRTIAEALNLGLDSFALVDDSAVERAEVKARWPQVRVYADDEAGRLPGYSEFDVPVTAESAARRHLYVTEARRQDEVLRFADGHDEFLRHCEIELTLFSPVDVDEIERILELLQRTNQLNLSTRRYSREALADLLGRADTLCLAARAKDKFGDYGIVGFASVELRPQPRLSEFVMSCRVMKKRLENAWFSWIFSFARSLGHDTVLADFVPTPRNGLLLEVLEDLGFVRASSQGPAISLTRSLTDPVPLADIVRVDASRLEAEARVNRALGDGLRG